MRVKKDNMSIHQKRVAAPLLSWDIFMEGYWKTMALAEDKIQLNKLAGRGAWQHSWNLEGILIKEGKVIIVTDPFLTIIFASSNIKAMNGYSASEVIGKTPKIFQGKDTDEHAKKGIRESLQQRQHFRISLINYKKNGQPYTCTIDGFPVFNKQQKLVNFIAFETAA